MRTWLTGRSALATLLTCVGTVACGADTAEPEATETAKADFLLGWDYVEVPGTKCLDGDTAGYGIRVRPGSDKLMIYFEGGGACFNDACDFTAFSAPFVPPTDGVFNAFNPLNPVGDWNMVYVPYCTGDIHAGDAEAVLGGRKRYFHGYSNVTKFLEQWVARFPNVTTVLGTGISAGGFGAGINASQIADAFGPSRKLVLVDDSGPPLSNKAMPPCLQEQFRQVWALDRTILAACGADCDPNDFGTGLVKHLDGAYPNARVGLISNTADIVIRTFMGFGWGNGEYNNCGGIPTPVPSEVYESELRAVRARYSHRSSTYYIGQDDWLAGFGKGHTALRTPVFTLLHVDGVGLTEWLDDVIAGRVTHVGD